MDRFFEGEFKGTVREWGYDRPPMNRSIIRRSRTGSTSPKPTVGRLQVTPDAAFAAFTTVVPLKAG